MTSIISKTLAMMYLVVSELMVEDRLGRSDLEFLVRALRERGVADDTVILFRVKFEEVVLAAQAVEESKHNLDPNSSLHSTVSSYRLLQEQEFISGLQQARQRYYVAVEENITSPVF